MTPSTVERPEADQDRAGGVHEGLGGEQKPPVLGVLANGTLRGPKGRFLPGVVPTNAITSERARDLTALRWAKAEQATRDAIKRKAAEGGISANTAPQAFGEAVGEVYAGAVANALDRPHDAARALKFVGQAAGLLRPQERTSNLPQVAVQVVLGDRVVESMRAGGVVVDAEATEV